MLTKFKKKKRNEFNFYTIPLDTKKNQKKKESTLSVHFDRG